MNKWVMGWILGLAAGLYGVTGQAQDLYVWSGAANLNWNTTDANWQIDGAGGV